MAIATATILQQQALWPQGDIRDPLGVWGADWVVPGDATVEDIVVTINTPLGTASAYMYTLLDANIIQTAGTPTTNVLMLQWRTGWPDLDAAAGIQPYVANRVATFRGSTNFQDSPLSGINALDNWVPSNWRYILSFDPRLGFQSSRTIATIKLDNIGVGTDFAGQLYGYFWDRSVFNAPGGPRHPGF